MPLKAFMNPKIGVITTQMELSSIKEGSLTRPPSPPTVLGRKSMITAIKPLPNSDSGSGMPLSDGQKSLKKHMKPSKMTTSISLKD